MKKSSNYSILYSHRTRGQDVEGVHIRGIANALRKMGNNVHFISVPGVDAEKNAVLVKEKTKNGHPGFWTRMGKYCPQLLFELMELFYNLILYRNLKKTFKDQTFDFIYERYALNTFATVLFGKIHNIPVILEINDATGIKRVRQHKAIFIAKCIESWIFKNADALITISSRFVQILLDKGVQKQKISYVPNAVDIDVFSPTKYADTIRENLNIQNKIVIGFVGSFAKWHGLSLLLKIGTDLVKKNSKIHFLLVGDGGYLPELMHGVEELGLTDNVTFTGRIAPNKVPLYLKAMDIGLIPDSNDYGSPMKLFEYMAMGAVPVVPKLPPLLDVICDGVTGLLFEPNNSECMKKKLIKICQDDDLRHKIARKNISVVAEKYLWEHNADHILSIYEKIKF